MNPHPSKNTVIEYVKNFKTKRVNVILPHPVVMRPKGPRKNRIIKRFELKLLVVRNFIGIIEQTVMRE
jgi:hypothetical protein